MQSSNSTTIQKASLEESIKCPNWNSSIGMVQLSERVSKLTIKDGLINVH